MTLRANTGWGRKVNRCYRSCAGILAKQGSLPLHCIALQGSPPMAAQEGARARALALAQALFCATYIQWKCLRAWHRLSPRLSLAGFLGERRMHLDVQMQMQRWERGGGKWDLSWASCLPRCLPPPLQEWGVWALRLATPIAHHKDRYSAWFRLENFKQLNSSLNGSQYMESKMQSRI